MYEIEGCSSRIQPREFGASPLSLQILKAAENANWQPDFTDQVLKFSHSMLDKVNGGLTAGVGVILLLWTVISIMGRIEGALNHPKRRRKSPGI